MNLSRRWKKTLPVKTKPIVDQGLSPNSPSQASNLIGANSLEIRPIPSQIRATSPTNMVTEIEEYPLPSPRVKDSHMWTSDSDQQGMSPGSQSHWDSGEGMVTSGSASCSAKDDHIGTVSVGSGSGSGSGGGSGNGNGNGNNNVLGRMSSGGLLRLEGSQGWTASRWQPGDEKPQGVVEPDATGPIQFEFRPHGDMPNRSQSLPTTGVSAMGGQNEVNMGRLRPVDVGGPSARPPPNRSEPMVGAPVQTSEVNVMQEELLELRTDNMLLREHVKSQLREILKLKSQPQNGESAHTEHQSNPLQRRPGVSPGKEWINLELDRLKSEYQFKSQIAGMLRSTLSGMRNTNKARGAQTQGQPVLGSEQPARGVFAGNPLGSLGPSTSMPTSTQVVRNDAAISRSRSAPTEELASVKAQLEGRTKQVSELESDIEALEAHVKLLTEALDEERHDNQDLVQENNVLKSQVEKLTVAGEKLLKGMTSMRGLQD